MKSNNKPYWKLTDKEKQDRKKDFLTNFGVILALAVCFFFILPLLMLFVGAIILLLALV